MAGSGSSSRSALAWWFLAPTLVGMLLVHFLPMVQGIWLSFLVSRKSNLLLYLKAPIPENGLLGNYQDVLLDSSMQVGMLDAIRNTFWYALIVTIGTSVLGLVGALLLNRTFRGRGLARTLLLFPWIVPTYVVGLLWGFMWQQDSGIVNIVLHDWLHLVHDKPQWLLGPNTIWAIILPTIWRFWPYSMLMLLAGLQNIPHDVYEAASLDGAGPWMRFRQITLPLLTPVWSILVLNGMIFNVYSFNIVIMMFGNGAGFPGKHGDLIMTAIFRNSFQMWDFGHGAAMSVLLMLVMLVLVAVWYRIFREDLTAR
jgi:multiple sugar transport system permease protein